MVYFQIYSRNVAPVPEDIFSPLPPTKLNKRKRHYRQDGPAIVIDDEDDAMDEDKLNDEEEEEKEDIITLARCVVKHLTNLEALSLPPIGIAKLLPILPKSLKYFNLQNVELDQPQVEKLQSMGITWCNTHAQIIKMQNIEVEPTKENLANSTTTPTTTTTTTTTTTIDTIGCTTKPPEFPMLAEYFKTDIYRPHDNKKKVTKKKKDGEHNKSINEEEGELEKDKPPLEWKDSSSEEEGDGDNDLTDGDEDDQEFHRALLLRNLYGNGEGPLNFLDLIEDEDEGDDFSGGDEDDTGDGGNPDNS